MKNVHYDYNAAVEKPVAEKYGKETVQDFRSLWQVEKEKDYLQQLKKRRVRNRNKRNMAVSKDP